MKKSSLLLSLFVTSLSGVETFVINHKTDINAILCNTPNQNGRLDQTFGNNNTGTPGTTFLTPTIIPGGTDNLTGMLIDSSGNIVCGGYSTAVDLNYFSIARYLP